MTFVDLLNEAFAGPAWQGPTLKNSLGGVSETQASWRPTPRRHNIWEVVVHAAYWKHVVRQRVTGRRNRFPLRGRNFFVRPGGARGWEDDVSLHVMEHERLVEVVKGMTPRGLARVVHAGQTAEENIRGIAAHDVYHAGQIQLLKVLAKR